MFQLGSVAIIPPLFLFPSQALILPGAVTDFPVLSTLGFWQRPWDPTTAIPPPSSCLVDAMGSGATRYPGPGQNIAATFLLFSSVPKTFEVPYHRYSPVCP